MNIAVITGTSSGLGVQYAKTVVELYPKLDEIWLIARRKDMHCILQVDFTRHIDSHQKSCLLRA